MNTMCNLKNGLLNQVTIASYIFDSLHIEQTKVDHNQRINSNYTVKINKSNKKDNPANRSNVDERQYNHYY
jgi:hypothetical protein